MHRVGEVRTQPAQAPAVIVAHASERTRESHQPLVTMIVQPALTSLLAHVMPSLAAEVTACTASIATLRSTLQGLCPGVATSEARALAAPSGGVAGASGTMQLRAPPACDPLSCMLSLQRRERLGQVSPRWVMLAAVSASCL